MADHSGSRREEIQTNLAAVRLRVAAACAEAGREPSSITTVVVTKAFPFEDIATLAELGEREIGENRDQEASDKVARMRTGPDEHALRQVRWHCIGRLQTNKARSVAAWADVVHTVDSVRLAHALAKAVQRLRDQGIAKTLPCLIQVSLDADPSRGGVPQDQALHLAAEVKDLTGVQLRGVMAVAPLGVDPDRAFADLQQVAQDVQAQFPQATWISAGMSADLEQAVANGATHLRVGGAILGNRPPLR